MKMNPKCLIWIYNCTIEVDLSGNTVWLQASGYQKLAKITLFAFLISFLATPNVNVARFACNVVCDFLIDFQTLCVVNNLVYLRFRIEK